MIKEVFQQNKNNNDVEKMYNTIKLLINRKQKTQFLTPGESFTISNKHWFLI